MVAMVTSLSLIGHQLLPVNKEFRGFGQSLVKTRPCVVGNVATKGRAAEIARRRVPGSLRKVHVTKKPLKPAILTQKMGL
jgi:hypothetical protein